MTAPTHNDMHAALSHPHLSVITRSADPELRRIQDKLDHKLFVDGRTELEELLGRLLDIATPGVWLAPKTLDLIGHSTGRSSLLQLGDWVIDHASPTVTAFFRELADQEVLPRLGIHAVRLLGCQTADTGRGRATIIALANILGVEVYGTRELVYEAHYDRAGYREECAHVLVGASDLRSHREPRALREDAPPYPRTLDIDTLPAQPLAAHVHAWPRRVATLETARAFVGLLRRREGVVLSGPVLAPTCEVALPAGADRYYRAEILLDGALARVYPDGEGQPGVVFPVSAAATLRALLDRM